ncbi:MAG: DivIVA domain-containing protein [Myxococcota bacterium]|nr:DivIVA domain-containing protein [Myxococcota bacterium]
MRLSPLDIQNHHFSSRLRGLDRAEVETFLQLVSEDFESLLRECEGLRKRVRELEARVEELSGNEKMLQETLVTAQGLSEDLKRTAMREAEVMVSQAEVQAEKILDASHRRASKLAEDIRELKQLRSRLGSSLRSTIETHLALLESLTEGGEEEPDEAKIAYLARPETKKAAPGEG